MSYSGAPLSTSGFYKLPPIIAANCDKTFWAGLNKFIESELDGTNQEDYEQRYQVYKAVFNKVIEHATMYKTVLTRIQKEYEDTIEAIKNDQQEAAFLQGKLKSMTSEPCTILNYTKRADELKERIIFIKRDNERLQKELSEVQAVKAEREKRAQPMEAIPVQLKKDIRSIPGLTLEKATDMKFLKNKYETLDRQVKEINNSLRTRYLPKSHKMKLKETLDNKVAYRDQLQWQSQVYKSRVQKLKITLEATETYNQIKPPHQTVGDAVTLAFQQASRLFKFEKEKNELEQTEVSQTATLDDDDPEMEQVAEMMLEYIEKFNELFENGFYEEAAIHAANSPKGILRTQATLAKFRDVKIKCQGRSPLLAFCDVMMSTVKAAGCKPNEALSIDCVEASLKENRLDLLQHWLAQDRLTISYQLGKMITDHCSCLIPCMCGCQVMAQNIFIQLKAHKDAILSMLKQGKVYITSQYARHYNCIDSEDVKDILSLNVCQDLVNGLMACDHLGMTPYLNLTVGKILLCLTELNKLEQATNLLCAMLKPSVQNKEIILHMLPLQRAVILDRETTREQWSQIIQFLSAGGQPEVCLQLVSLTTVLDVICRAWNIVQEDKKTVSFSLEVETCSDSNNDDDDSNSGLLSRSRESNSYDHSSREMSPEFSLPQQNSRQSILKKVVVPVLTVDQEFTKPFSRITLSPPPKKRVAHVGSRKSSSVEEIRNDKHIEKLGNSSDQKSLSLKSGGGIRFMDNDPYTSNPESADESDAE